MLAVVHDLKAREDGIAFRCVGKLDVVGVEQDVAHSVGIGVGDVLHFTVGDYSPEAQLHGFVTRIGENIDHFVEVAKLHRIVGDLYLAFFALGYRGLGPCRDHTSTHRIDIGHNQWCAFLVLELEGGCDGLFPKCGTDTDICGIEDDFLRHGREGCQQGDAVDDISFETHFSFWI